MAIAEILSVSFPPSDLTVSLTGPQKAASVQDSIVELESYVSRLNSMIDTSLVPLSPDRCPEKLTERMQAMAK